MVPTDPSLRPQRVLPATRTWPLHDTAATRRVEASAQAGLATHTLMGRAGAAVAQLGQAIAPHARRILVLAGPGNNGGDGLEAASRWQQRGVAVRVALLGAPARLPADAQWALGRAQAAGVVVSEGLPPDWQADLLVDALLGIGGRRAPEGALRDAIGRLNRASAPVLAIDVPSGLDADTGALHGADAVVATHTLCLLSLKPGLFTAHGRDHAGTVWYSALGVDVSAPPSARLLGPASATPRRHAHHKGSFGDVLVVGGAPGMGGAALLAARAALAAGAGRVYLSPLDAAATALDPQRPELMLRPAQWHADPAWLAASTVVCGCGGGEAVREVLPALLAHAGRLVLDADALNAVAGDVQLQSQLSVRAARGRPTVLTPHPLEAARLLELDVATVQADRLGHAGALARRFDGVVVLKGSGTVLAAPGQVAAINPSGNARLASAGTGDVLAGWLGGRWAQAGDASVETALRVSADSVFVHGCAAMAGAERHAPLRATDLIEAMLDAAG